MSTYEDVQRRLARGWNTWNTRSVLSHVRLPEGFAINLGLKEYSSRRYLKQAFVGQKDPNQEQIHPGPRTYDGTYTELHLEWQGLKIYVQSAVAGDDLVLLVTPETQHRKAPLLVVEPGILWNRPGYVVRDGETLVGHCPEHTFHVYGTAACVEDPYISVQTGYLGMPLHGPVGVSTGKQRTVPEIQAILAQNKAQHMAYVDTFGDLAEVYSAIQTCLAWDTVYDPEHDRVISPVSRRWNMGWGGYVLFDWDTYFAAYIAALDNADLAYVNAIEITHEKTERGFIPNFASVCNVKSRDRSQPPVGSIVVREIYRKHGGKWFLEEIFDDLLAWNRWWPAQRQDESGLLCWGSNTYKPVLDAPFEVERVHNWQAAAFESGLDNSPMYDDVPFNESTHLMELADVGLNGMYVMDCEALADIASVLDKQDEAAELRERAATFRAALKTLWDEDSGMFLNRRTDTGAFSPRLSPTNFYALLGKAATQKQAQRMMTEHFYNPEEFWGDWIMPSIARNDPAYPDQNYWRGRIWAPMNMLVYIGLCQYALPQAQADLAEKSKQLLLKEWQSHGHVHENYSADTGDGCGVRNSDAFYHWGGLLGLIAFIEAGYMDKPR